VQRETEASLVWMVCQVCREDKDLRAHQDQQVCQDSLDLREIWAGLALMDVQVVMACLETQARKETLALDVLALKEMVVTLEWLGGLVSQGSKATRENQAGHRLTPSKETKGCPVYQDLQVYEVLMEKRDSQDSVVTQVCQVWMVLQARRVTVVWMAYLESQDHED